MSGPTDDDPQRPPSPEPPPPPPPEPPIQGVDLGKHDREPAPGSGDEPPAGPPPPGYHPPPTPGYGPPPAYPPPSPGYGPPPGYPPAGYAPGYPPPYGGPYPGPRRTSGMAIASMVLGIGSLVCCPIFGPVALFLGLRARRQVKETGEEGETFATVGAITGGIGTAFAALIIAFYLFAIVLAVSTDSPRTTFPPPRASTTRRPTTTAPSGAVPGTRSGSTVLPATCARLRSALDDIDSPADSSAPRLTSSAATLIEILGPAYREDVTTVVVDGLSRVGQGDTGQARPAAVVAASDNLHAASDELCG